MSPPLLLRLLLATSAERFWYDEAFSVLTARAPWGALLAATAHDVHPPLYYALLKVWLSVGLWPTVEIGARSFSLILSFFALFLFAQLMARLELSELQARLALLLAAWSPGLVFFSAEARMYALLSVEVLGALLALRARRWGWAVLAFAALLWTHNAGAYYALCIFLAAGLWAWSDGDALPSGGLFVVVLGAGALYAPWASVLLQQVAATAEGYWIGAPGLLNAPYVLIQSVFYVMRPNAVFLVLSSILAGGLTVWAALLAGRRAWLLLICAGPLAISVLISAITGTGALIGRVLVPGSFALFILWAGLLARKDVGRLLTGLTFGALAWGCAAFIGGRGVADFQFVDLIQAGAHSGDIIYSPTPGALPLALYRPDEVAFYVAPIVDEIRAGLTLETQAALGLRRAWLEDVPWRRAWIIEEDSLLTGDAERAYLAETLRRYQHDKIAEVNLTEYATARLWLLERN